MKLKLVEVEWIDITNENSWVDFEDLEKSIAKEQAQTCLSVGYLHKKDAKWVVILPTVILKDGNIDRCGFELIPAGCIIRIRHIRR